MSLILSGSDGLSDVDGSAATPALRGTDANTGIFFPAADTIAFSEGGVEAMRIDSSGNVGIGISSVESGFRLHVVGNTFVQNPVGQTVGKVVVDNADNRLVLGSYFEAGVGQLSFISSTDNAETANIPLAFRTGTTERMRIDSSGNVGIGTSSPARKLQVKGIVGFEAISGSTNTWENYTFTDNSLRWNYNGSGADEMTITSSGNVGIGTDSPTVPLTFANTVGSAGAANKIRLLDNGSAVFGFGISASALDYRADNHVFYTIASSPTERMRIDSSGSLNINQTSSNGATLNITGFNVNYGTAEFSCPSKGTNNSHIHFGTFGDWYIRPANLSGSVYVRNYVAESDARLKTNIEPTPYGLNEILALTPRKFNWIDGGDVENNGFIAQEVEEVLPALVAEGQWKSVDYQGITSIIVKAIQELKATVDAQAARIAALEKK